METGQKKLNRKKFLGWTATVASILAIPAFLRPPSKKQETKTVKMLGQDGKLVEVDLAHLTGARKKVNNQELQTWVKSNDQLNREP